MSILQGVFLLFKLYAQCTLSVLILMRHNSLVTHSLRERSPKQCTERERDVYYDYSNKLSLLALLICEDITKFIGHFGDSRRSMIAGEMHPFPCSYISIAAAQLALSGNVWFEICRLCSWAFLFLSNQLNYKWRKISTVFSPPAGVNRVMLK